MIIPPHAIFKNTIEALNRRLERLESTLDEILSNFQAAEKLEDTVSPGYTVRQHMMLVEADILRKILENSNYNIDAAAVASGYSADEMRIRIRHYGLKLQDPDAGERLKLERDRLKQERFLQGLECLDTTDKGTKR